MENQQEKCTERRLRVAFFSPIPPQRTGVAAYTAFLLPHLLRYYAITLFCESPAEAPEDLTAAVEIRQLRDFEWLHVRQPFDRIIYQIGNHLSHRHLFDILFQHPGIVVFHDLCLHQVRGWHLLQTAQNEGYLAEAEYCHGEAGRCSAQLVSNGFAGPLLFDFFPLNRHVVEASNGVLVHNQWAAEQVRTIDADIPVEIAPLPVAAIRADPPDTDSRNGARRQLGIPPAAFVVVSFGFITPFKGIEPMFRALQRIGDAIPVLQYILVGQTSRDFPVRQLIRKYGLQDCVHISGYLPDDRYRLHQEAADLCVNLRYPAHGESSAAMWNALAAGLPTIIPEYRQFREIPKDCTVQVPLGSALPTRLADALVELYRDPVRRGTMAVAALEHAGRHHIRHTVAGYRRILDPCPIARQAFLLRSTLPHIPDISAAAASSWREQSRFLFGEEIQSVQSLITELGLEPATTDDHA